MRDAALQHPVVSAFAGLAEACLCLAGRHPAKTFAVSVAPEGSEVLVYAEGGVLAPVHRIDGLTGHRHMVLAQDARAVVACADAWHQACAALPGLAGLVGTGHLAFSKDTLAFFDWKAACFTEPGRAPFLDPVATDLAGLLASLAKGVGAALEAPANPGVIGLFDQGGTCKARVEADPVVARHLLPFLFLSAFVGAAQERPFVAKAAGRFTFFDVEEEACALHAAYDAAPVGAFWDSVQRLNVALASPLPKPITALRLFAQDGRAWVQTVLEDVLPPRALAGPSGAFAAAADQRYRDVLAPIERLWAEAVALLPADGQWRHAGLKAVLSCRDGTERTPPAFLTSANLAHRGKHGWASGDTTRALGLRATGTPYLVALTPRSQVLRVDAANPRAAAATAIAAYSGAQAPQPYAWSMPLDVWSAMDT